MMSELAWFMVGSWIGFAICAVLNANGDDDDG